MSSIPSIIHTDRAIRDLRSAVPVLLYNDNSAQLVMAAEYADKPGTLPPPEGRPFTRIVLSAERATTLGGKNEITTLDAAALSAAQRDALINPLSTDKISLASYAPSPANALDRTAITLAKHAELLPALMGAPLDFQGRAAQQWAWDHGLLPLNANAVMDYTTHQSEALLQVSDALVPIDDAGTFHIRCYRPANGGLEHLALVAGDPSSSTEAVPIRLHSSCLTGDILGSLKCDCGEQLRKAIHDIGKAGCGVVLYLNQEGRGIGIANKLKAYQLQDDGNDTFDANEMLGYAADERHFGIAAEILRQLGVKNVRLMTNNPSKIAQMEAYGLTVERVAHHVDANEVNAPYLHAKRTKGGHLGE